MPDQIEHPSARRAHPTPSANRSPRLTASPDPARRDEPRGVTIPIGRTDRVLGALRLALAIVFVVAGAATLVGVPDAVASFGTVEGVTGLGAWIRPATGLLEVLGGTLLVVRAAAGVGAVLLSAVMAGAVLTHVLVLGSAPTAPTVLLAALAPVGYAHRSAIRAFAAALERNL